MAVKRWLGEATLSSMELAFAGKQTFTEQALGTLEYQAFHKVLIVGYEDVFNEIWMIEKEYFLGTDAKERNVAEALGQVLQVGQRPATIGEQAAKRQTA
jgi:hypothetical protein